MNQIFLIALELWNMQTHRMNRLNTKCGLNHHDFSIFHCPPFAVPGGQANKSTLTALLEIQKTTYLLTSRIEAMVEGSPTYRIYIAYNEHKQSDIHKQYKPNQIVQKLCHMQTHCMDSLKMKCKLSPYDLLISHYPPVAALGEVATKPATSMHNW